MSRRIKCAWCSKLYATNKTLKQHHLSCQAKKTADDMNLKASVAAEVTKEVTKRVEESNDDIEHQLHAQIQQLKTENAKLKEIIKGVKDLVLLDL